MEEARRISISLSPHFDPSGLTVDHDYLAYAPIKTNFEFSDQSPRRVHLLVSGDGRYVVGAQQAMSDRGRLLEGVVKVWDRDRGGYDIWSWDTLGRDSIRSISFTPDQKNILTFPDLHLVSA